MAEEPRVDNKRSRTQRIIWWVVTLLVLLLVIPIFVRAVQNSIGPKPQVDPCLANLRELSRAVLDYANANGGRLPDAVKWSDQVQPFARARGSSFVCGLRHDLRSGYAFNVALSGRHLDDIKDPERTVLIFESDLGWNGAGGLEDLPAQPRHRGGDEFAFVSGNTGWISRGNAGATVAWNIER